MIRERSECLNALESAAEASGGVSKWHDYIT